MPLSELDINKLSKLISPHVDQVTCVECCKYYLVPSTAPCGHTLCHGCWSGRKKCATCGAAVSRKSLKLNLQLQKVTEHTQRLREEFEKIFQVNWDEFLLDTPIGKTFTKDPTKNVRDWLANSENQFSAPESSQLHSTQDLNNQQKEISNKVQIHTETSKTSSAKNIIHVAVPQDDWDKIEEMPDTENFHTKDKENAIGPMDIEPFVIDPFEFTTDNPRRSSRKRDGKGNMLLNSETNSVNQSSTKDSTKGTDSKVSKQNWANVKRMKKEFSKLNKKSKNKLNVSIEMCKRTLIPVNKNIHVRPDNNSEEPIISIDDNTPNVINPKEYATTKEVSKDQLSNNNIFDDIGKAKKINEIHSNTQINENTKSIADAINIGQNQYKTIKATSPQPCDTENEQFQTVPFIVKGALQGLANKQSIDCFDNNNQQTIIVNTDDAKQTRGSEDIEITIKIGSTITNICIKNKRRKEQDVKLKINADREIQTTLEKHTQINKNNASCSAIRGLDPENNVLVTVENNKHRTQQEKCISNDKALSDSKTSLSKKNTESAETATAQYDITESIEKELSKEMEKSAVEIIQRTLRSDKKNNTSKSICENEVLDEDFLNDLDIFDNESIKEGNVQSLKSSKHAPSEILVSTMKSNISTKQIDKRIREAVSDDLPTTKKMKIIHESNETEIIGATSKTVQSNNLDQDSELNNYDFIMGKVFANIDLDLAKKSDEKLVKNSQSVAKKINKTVTPVNVKTTPNLCDSTHGQSENVFSLLEKENDVVDELPVRKTHERIENQMARCNDVVDQIELIEGLGTPMQGDNDHSNESIVEETPQKNTSFQKTKQKSDGSPNAENTVQTKFLKLKRTRLVEAQKSSDTPIMSVISLSDITDDITRKSKHVTVTEPGKPRPALETPVTIKHFVEQIKHKSTPMAKKSLNFDNENTESTDIDPEQTLCPSSFIAAKTTQEKEFMCKAFEDSPVSRSKSPLTMRHIRMRTMKYCLAGSCLTPSEISNVKLLCSMRKWDYVDKYTKDLTHLVVGVDEENKSQRSVKYMCALAASKWIVSYEWVQKCLQMKKVIEEEPYEALDNTGEPGPQRSRIAKQKLFKGITFYCMPPFSVLDVESLQGMLEAAGGRVVGEANAVRVTSNSVALLLAEPEHTQENRFIYLAMELSIVPVNSEWVLNCLGSYTLSSVLELLLCPESLLPPATANWPPDLMAKDFD